MKKWIPGVISLLFIAVILVDVLIPSPIIISNDIPLRASPDAVYRILTQQDKWDKLSDGSYLVTNCLLNTIYVNVRHDQLTIPIKIFLIPLAKDSVLLTWKSTLPKVKGPLARLNQYSAARAVKMKIDSDIITFKTLMQKSEYTYGIPINESSTNDTLLIATRFNTTSYPSMEEIYRHITALKKFSANRQARVTGFPMLNVTKKDSGLFRCMIALPLNKTIEGTGPFFFVRMVPGKFLTARIYGGPGAIQHGHDMMQLYFSDYNRTAMAVPFEYMVTNRLDERDTTKWVTAIYAPVY